ncbi:hypothetical protein ABZT03_26785 [Streptomyces sp. NPDC005574]|uniref:hypothetical protein n=1 Tax=Streptomyces sp. NPDC005574 TaxID=3156891 RepID=UPI0033B04D3E
MTPITGMDLTGFTEREPGVWMDERGVLLSVHYFDQVPDLPAPLEEPERLRSVLAHGVAAAGGGLIEAAAGVVDGVPAVLQLVKMPRPDGHGQVFLGSWTVPRAGCSTVVKVQAAEGATTGMREAMIMGQVGPAEYFRAHPYANGLQGGLPYHVGDHEEWDARFPDHPLTLVRAALRRIAPTVTLDERFKTLPPFGPPAQAPSAGGGFGAPTGPRQAVPSPAAPAGPAGGAPGGPAGPSAPPATGSSPMPLQPGPGWFRRRGRR